MEEEGLAGTENTTRDALRALQLQRLKWTITHAYENVACYRRKCNQRGIAPNDLGTFEDLREFPFTVKDDLRRHYPFGMFAVPMERLARLHVSSGTTGKPTIVGYTRNDIETWAIVCARSISAAGGRASDKIHVAYGYGLFTGGLGIHYGAERLGATVIPMSSGQTAKQVQLIQDLSPDVIACTPSYMLNIADEFARRGIDCRGSSLRLGIFGAEPWSEAMRDDIQKRCGLKAVDIYGLSEIIGPGVAVERAESGDGLVVWEDFFYPEIVDSETGEVLGEGQRGELVLTSLTKEAMPVVRYRTHDLTRLLPGTTGPMRRMDRVTGRTDDMLIIRGVNIFPSQVEEQVLKAPELAPHYQLHITRERALDVLTVLVERSEGTPQSDCTSIASALESRIKDYLGVSANVKVLGPGKMPRSEGKAVRVIDERD